MRHGFALALVLCGSCATIIAPGPDVLTVTSDPPGVTVRLRGVDVGTTPMELSIPRQSDGNEMTEPVQVDLHCETHHTQTVMVQKVVNGWVFLNLVTPTFILGYLFDFGTANWLKVPGGQTLHVVMSPTSRPAPGMLKFPLTPKP